MGTAPSSDHTMNCCKWNNSATMMKTFPWEIDQWKFCVSSPQWSDIAILYFRRRIVVVDYILSLPFQFINCNSVTKHVVHSMFSLFSFFSEKLVKFPTTAPSFRMHLTNLKPLHTALKDSEKKKQKIKQKKNNIFHKH